MKHFGSTSGLTALVEDQATPANGMVAYVTSSYNSGYQNGDIKGAFLSDTDDTDLVASGELVTNGTFDTDVSGWTPAAPATATWNAGSVNLARNSGSSVQNLYQALSLTVGATYIFTITVSALSNALSLFSTGGGAIIGSAILSPGTYSFSHTWGASDDGIYVGLGGSLTATATIDNISVRLADADRSVNNNGLIVNGTVTRSAVTTGAELVAYSGFSASNYLEQPYNSDLDFGTGDFCVMGWFNLPAGGSQYHIVDRKDAVGATGSAWQVKVENTSQKLYFSITDDYYTTRDEVLSSMPVDTGAWTFGCAVRSGSTIYIYVNGGLAGSTAITNATGSLSKVDAKLLVGIVAGGSIPFAGSLALWRISATAPTADQIAKIYEDEKFLFQDNAACTLYGASDAVTALAHDSGTGLLHVGTSAGRSVFQGLRRVDNTTTAVETAISASGGLVVEE